MSELKISQIGLKSYHLDSVIKETTLSIILDLDRRYSHGQFAYLMNYGRLSYEQIVLKAIIDNVNNIESIVVSDPVNEKSDHEKGFLGAIDDLDYEGNVLLVYDNQGRHYNISPNEIEKINFKSLEENEKIKNYINNKRMHCLECDETNCFNFGKLNLSNENVFQYVFCRNCKSEWVCEYTISYVHANIQ